MTHNILYICYMKFYEKYPKLKDKAYLKKVLTDTVFSTMSLEDQEVKRSKVEKIVSLVLKKKESEGDQFFAD